MKTFFFILSACSVSAMSQKMLFAYFTSWGAYKGFTPDKIPAGNITHLLYAFAKADSNTNTIQLTDSWIDVDKRYGNEPTDAAYMGNIYQINNVIKKANPNLKTLISVGGWTLSYTFPAVAATESGRQTFARSCADFIAKYNFDGVDIDWEYPKAEDTQNFHLFMKALRDALPADKLLTIAITANTDTAIAYGSWKNISDMVDYMNVMSYDYRGSWSTSTGHLANWYPTDASDTNLKEKFSTQEMLQYLTANQVPMSKIIIGAPLYGRGWSGVPSNNSGLYEPFSQVPIGSTGLADGVFFYSDIMKLVQSGTHQLFYDSKSVGSWVYSSSSQQMIAFDDRKSMAMKVALSMQQGCAGMMVWELSNDPNNELIETISECMLL